MKRYSGAYLTVYLALTMTVLLSLILALVEGARSNAVCMEAECITDIGMNSIFSEYHRELFGQFNLFAIDSTYGSGYASEANTQQHLQNYIRENLTFQEIQGKLYRDLLGISADKVRITGVSVYTDDAGAVFRRRAAEAVKDDIGLGLLEELTGWVGTVEEKHLNESNIPEEKQAVDEQIDAYKSERQSAPETEYAELEIENPTVRLENLRKRGILDSVIEKPQELSPMGLYKDALLSTRMEEGKFNRGNMQLEEAEGLEDITERFFFQEYLLRYLGRYGKEKENGAVSYQLEYILAGKDSDVENLKSVANTLCLIREAANAVYLFTDDQKRAEVEAVAAVSSALLLLPELKPLFETAMILGWAYAESLYDVETLLAGGNIPLIKTKESWHYDLETALSGEMDEAGRSKEGLSYEDYLRVLMMFQNIDTLTVRAMDMVEADIRQTKGNGNFRLDGCYDAVRAEISYESAYGYQCRIIRQKSYGYY